MVGLYYGVAEEEHGTNLENTPTFSFQRPGEGDCWPPWFNRIFEYARSRQAVTGRARNPSDARERQMDEP
ncbi:hypothetical protein VTH82DRAFT_3626 [Thermothelomyces myriococcoides]